MLYNGRYRGSDCVQLPVVLSAAFSWCGGSVDTDASWGLKSVGVFCSPLTVQTLVDMILIAGQSKKSKAYRSNRGFELNRAKQKSV